MQSPSSVADVFALLERGGGEAYFGEPVSVLEHCLQSAHFVREHGGSDALVAAALLHDVGHLLHTEGEDAANRGLDTQHEELGVEWLGQHLPVSILDPVRMHVDAKRYLCSVDSNYFAELSPASRESLALQGGVMTPEQAKQFIAQPHAAEAITLRHADDAAKIRGLAVPQLESYKALIENFWN